MHKMKFLMAKFGRVLILFGTVLGAGCSGKPAGLGLPSLHSVKGLLTINGLPAKGGNLALRPEPENSSIFISAVVGDDGRFELTTMHTEDREGKKNPGAPEGTYKATYLPASREQVKPIEIGALQRVEAGQVNEWTIEIVEKK